MANFPAIYKLLIISTKMLGYLLSLTGFGERVKTVKFEVSHDN